MSITQILGITLIIMAFIATVKIFYDLFYYDLKIKYLSNQITKTENKLKSEYNTMASDEVHYLYFKQNWLEIELFKLKNRK